MGATEGIVGFTSWRDRQSLLWSNGQAEVTHVGKRIAIAVVRDDNE